MAWEWTCFITMGVVFCGGVFVGNLPVGVALALSAVIGALMSGLGFQPIEMIRQLTEAEFAYFDPMMYIVSAMIFMVAIEKSGLLGTVARWLIVKFHRSPVLLLTAVTALVLFPGMMTGSSTAAVLSTGALVAPVLIKIGVPRARAGAIIAMIAVYGLCAPPVNIPALIIGAGADIPFLGFGLPLLLLSVPPAIIVTLWLGLRHVRGVTLADLEGSLPPSFHARHGFRLYVPLAILVFLLVAERTLPGIFQKIGLPMIFLLAAGSAMITGERTNPWNVTLVAIRRSIGILGILMGVGMFIQLMTYTGGRGVVAVTCAGLPREQLFPVIGISLPLFGAVSSYGAASVLGVPFLLSLLNRDVIITCSALSLCACLGDLMPPTALAGLFAAEVVEEKNYFKVLKPCIPPAILTAIFSVVVIIFANDLKGLALYDSNSYIGEGADIEIVAEPPPAAEVATASVFGGEWAISLFYQIYVGFLVVAVFTHFLREPKVRMRINAVLLLVPLLLRFFEVV